MPSHYLPHDTDISHIQIALDPDQMLVFFRNELTPLNMRSVRIERCRLSRFRYRKGQRLIILYELDIYVAETGETTTHWITGTTYPSKRTKNKYKRLKQCVLENSLFISQLPLIPVAYLSELNMLLQFFPIDRYLPSLSELMFEPPSELRQLICQTIGREQDKDNIQWKIDPVRYRPSIGATLHYLAKINGNKGDENNHEFFIKICRNNATNVFDNWNNLYKHSETSNYRFFGLARPIACLPKYQALIIERAKGEPLDDILQRGQNVSKTMVIIAKALAEFHQSNLPCRQENMQKADFQQARKAGEMIRWSCPHLTDSVSKIFNALEDKFIELPPHPTHMDLKPEHLFLNDEEVTFIDLDSYDCGDPVYDVAMLTVLLRELPNLKAVSLTTVDRAEKEFLSHYFQYVPDSWRARLPINNALATLKVSLYHVQHQQLHWEKKIDTLLTRAQTELSC